MRNRSQYHHPETPGIDLEFRPATYFAARPPATRTRGRPDPRLRRPYKPAWRPPRRLKLLADNYLPHLVEQEVEILRIRIGSTTCDETAVFAHRWWRGIFYRVVDEYDGLTLERPTAHTSAEPLTLRELMSYVDRVWSIYHVLDLNFAREGFDALAMQHFLLEASSVWYPDIEVAYRYRIDACGSHQRERLRARNAWSG